MKITVLNDVWTQSKKISVIMITSIMCTKHMCVEPHCSSCYIYASVCKGQDSEISGGASGHWTGLIHWPLIHCLTYIKINVWLKYMYE